MRRIENRDKVRVPKGFSEEKKFKVRLEGSEDTQLAYLSEISESELVKIEEVYTNYINLFFKINPTEIGEEEVELFTFKEKETDNPFDKELSIIDEIDKIKFKLDTVPSTKKV